jgi:histidine ammonia-lyase
MSDAAPMLLAAGALTLDDLQRLHAGGTSLAIDVAGRARIRASAEVVQRAAAGEAPVYGVNTGFGKLAGTRIGANDLALLQLNLIRSHSVGVGAPLAPRDRLSRACGDPARGLGRARRSSTRSLRSTTLGSCRSFRRRGRSALPGDLAPLAHPRSR